MSAATANALAADDLDVYDVSRENLVAAALKCTAVGRPPAPATHKIPRYELQGTWLSAVLFDLDVERLGHLAARAEKPPTFRRGHFETRAMGLGWRRSGTKTGL